MKKSMFQNIVYTLWQLFIKYKTMKLSNSFSYIWDKTNKTGEQQTQNSRVVTYEGRRKKWGKYPHKDTNILYSGSWFGQHGGF